MPLLGSVESLTASPAPPELVTAPAAGDANAYITAEQYAWWVSTTRGPYAASGG